MYVCVYIHIYIYICMYVCIHTHIAPHTLDETHWTATCQASPRRCLNQLCTSYDDDVY